MRARMIFTVDPYKLPIVVDTFQTLYLSEIYCLRSRRCSRNLFQTGTASTQKTLNPGFKDKEGLDDNISLEFH